MDVSWIGSTIVAVVGLASVVITAVLTSRANLARLEFEANQLEDQRIRDERQQITGAVEHIAEVMDSADEFANTEPPHDYNGPPFDLTEEWADWWESRRSQMRREVARIHDPTTRHVLEDVTDSLTWATRTAYWHPAKPNLYDTVMAAATAGFEAASAWLRGQAVGPDVIDRVASLKADVDSTKAALEAHRLGRPAPRT